MKLIVGLGNPDKQYEGTRHNAGFLAVDRLLKRFPPVSPRSQFRSQSFEIRSRGEKLTLLKPLTYMNRSGQAVQAAMSFYKLERDDLLVIYDDVALPAGRIRVRGAGGAGGHNGMADIQNRLASDRFARIRVGIDPPGRVPQVDYVLGRFSPEQWPAVDRALELAADAAMRWIADGVQAAMNAFNAAEQPERSAEPPTPSAEPPKDAPT